MSQDLYGFLKERAAIRVLRFPAGLALSAGAHVLVAGIILLAPRMAPAPETPKITWVSLPAAGGGTSGGVAPQEAGESGERIRRVEDVAPDHGGKAAPVTPNAFGTTRSAAPKGTNTDPTSMGKAPAAAKGATATPRTATGAAGQGQGGGIGVGTGVPGLKASGGAMGGVGLIGELDGNFPFVWYLQQVQNQITSNWSRVGGTQGRVQIYFRIRRDGGLDSIRTEVTSGNAALDRSAELAVRRSDPLPRLPEGFEGPYLGVRFWFSFVGE